MNKSLRLFLLSGIAVIGIYVALVLGEFVVTTRPLLYLRNNLNVSLTLLRICVLSVTVLPVAYLAGRGMILRSPTSGHKALAGVAAGFALIIGLLQTFVYDQSVLGASLLKVTLATAGLGLVAYRYRRVRQDREALDGRL